MVQLTQIMRTSLVIPAASYLEDSLNSHSCCSVRLAIRKLKRKQENCAFWFA
jgi:hypothetical protein